MRMQLVPFPAMRPRQPSSLHIFARAFGTDILYSFRPALCTWKRILRRSSGDTTVRETAPAVPPAMNDARTGCARTSLSRWRLVSSRAVRDYTGKVNWDIQSDTGKIRTPSPCPDSAAMLAVCGCDCPEGFDMAQLRAQERRKQ